MRKIQRSEIDFIISEIDIINFLETEYDADFITGSGDWAKCRCLLPAHEDKNPSFNVNVVLKSFKCFSCGAKGDIIELVQKVEGLSFIEACNKLIAFLGGFSDDSISQINKAAGDTHIYVDDFLNNFENIIFPANMSQAQFMMGVAKRLRALEIQKGKPAENYADKKYKELDEMLENPDNKKIQLFWNNLVQEYHD